MDDLAATVRRHDPDRYYCALFAPASLHPALFTLYAFNHELARAQEVAREPGLALIRLHWWREVVEGAARRHEVATPLRALLDAGALQRAVLLSMIDSREAELEPPTTLEDFIARMKAGPGALAAAAGCLLGADDAAQARLRTLGAAYGVAGTLGNVAALARHERCALPLDVLHAAGLAPHAAFSDPRAVQAAVWPALAARGLALLGKPVRLPRAVAAAGLPGVLAWRDLRRGVPAAGARGVGDRIAVMVAAARSKV